MLKFFLCLLIGISAVCSAPVDETPQKLQTNLKEAFGPVEKDVRAMIGNAQTGLRDVTNTAVDATKKEFAPVNKEDRANLGSNIISRGINSIKNVRRSILQRAIADVKPVAENAKSAMFGTNDAVNLLQSKYLTPDGQDLVKNVYKTAGIARKQ